MAAQKTTQVLFLAEPELVREIHAQAKLEDRSAASLLRQAARAYLQRAKKIASQAARGEQAA